MNFSHAKTSLENINLLCKSEKHFSLIFVMALTINFTLTK